MQPGLMPRCAEPKGLEPGFILLHCAAQGRRAAMSCYATTTHPCILRWELTVRVLGQQSIVSARVLASLAATQLLALPFAGVLRAGEARLRRGTGAVGSIVLCL